MDQAVIIREAQTYKRTFEKVEVISLPYKGKNGEIYWCAKFSRFGKVSGFAVFIKKGSPSFEEIREALWNIGMVTSLINGISAGIVEHYSKPLDYMVILQDYLLKWLTDFPKEASQFKSNIQKFEKMVTFYEESMREIRQLHIELNHEADQIKNNRFIEDEDTIKVLMLSSSYNYLKYSQLLEQEKTVDMIREIDHFLEETFTKPTSFLKELKKYTSYYINDKSLSFLEESLSDFSKYGKEIADLAKEEGETLMYDSYVIEQNFNFEKEFLALLRNKGYKL